MGRRFQKTVNGTNTAFIYDGWNLLQETTGTNVTRYIWGLDLSGSMQGAGGIGGLLCVIENGVPYYPATDANGNITDYVDTNGVVVAHREFDPFGNTIIASGPKINDFRFWFSSKYLDQETGLYYYGYRYLSTELGRWPSRDPIGIHGGPNLYAYVHNAPIGWIDGLGLMGTPPRGSAECGCCCVEDLTFVDDGRDPVDETSTWPYSQLAKHSFHIDVSMSWGPEDKEGNCTLTTTEPWTITGDCWGPCSGTDALDPPRTMSPTNGAYPDSPGLWLRRTDVSPWLLRTATRELTVKITVTSESGCTCSHSSKTITVKVNMDVSSGGVNSSSATED
jgi:RHS repeat-associated protein